MKRRSIVIYNIIILFNIYFFISVLFSVVYIALEFLELGSIIDHFSAVSHHNSLIGIIYRSLYFSFITLFAVGYGDLTPFGVSKIVAIIQAYLGYILPYAILLNYLIFKPKFPKKSKRENFFD